MENLDNIAERAAHRLSLAKQRSGIHNMDKAVSKKILFLLRSGVSLKRIAEETNTSVSTIENIFYKKNIKVCIECGTPLFAADIKKKLRFCNTCNESRSRKYDAGSYTTDALSSFVSRLNRRETYTQGLFH